MRVRTKYTDRIVLIFVVLGILLLVAFTSLVLVNNKVLTDKVYFKSVLDNATGLSRKPPIYFKGLEIGRIDDFELDFATNNIRVRFYIYTEYADKIVRYAVISRMGNLLLGTSSDYEILLPQLSLDGEFEPLAEGEIVPFINSALGQDYVSRGNIKVKFDGFEDILASVNEVLINLQRATDPQSGAIFTVLGKVEQIADSLLLSAQQLQQEQLGAETAKMLANLDDTIVHANEVVSDIEIVAAQAEEFFVKADDVAAQSQVLAKSANSSLIAASGAFATANSAFEEAQQTILDASLLIDSMQESVAQANLLLDQYNDPAGIIDEVSGNKIPGTIDKIDANLIYLQAILKEIYLQREQLAQAIISMNRTLISFDKTLQGVNNNPLLKDGITVEQKDNDGIEMQ